MSARMNGILVGAVLVCGNVLGASQTMAGSKLVPGDLVPPYQVQTASGEVIKSEHRSSKVTILVYIIAHQRGSERAVVDASKVVHDLDDQSVELLFVAAKTDESAYLTEFWQEKSIEETLAFDPDRKLYADLGLIAFPSTLIIDSEGKLAHALSTHSPNYPYVLSGYIQHALGLMNDAELNEYIQARSLPASSPKGLASRHRATAKLLREKGFYEGSEKELLEAIEVDPENLDARLDLAELYLYRKRVNDAKNLVGQVQKIDAQNRHAMLLEGIVLFHQANYSKAQQILDKTLVLNPDPARTHYYLGRIQEIQGNTDQALYHYRQALRRLLNEPADLIP